jgi:hypothetical protein
MPITLALDAAVEIERLSEKEGPLRMMASVW